MIYVIVIVGLMNSAWVHCSLLTWSTFAVEAKKKKKREREKEEEGENADLKHRLGSKPTLDLKMII